MFESRLEGGKETLRQHIQRTSQRELIDVLGCGDRPDEGLEICGLTSQIEYHIKLKFQSIKSKEKGNMRRFKSLETPRYVALSYAIPFKSVVDFLFQTKW